MRPWYWAFWYDETGAPSMARGLLSGVTLFVMSFTMADIRGAEVGTHVYDNWFGYMLALVVWAGGPRMAAHLTPIALAVVQRVRGIMAAGSSYSRTEVEQTTVAPVVDDDPVKDDKVIM